MRLIHASLLFLSLLGVSAPPEPAPPPAAPTIVIAPGAKQPAPPPTASVMLKGSEFEILTLAGYSGITTWDVTADDAAAVPVKLFELKPKESVIGLRAGATVPDRHEAPDAQSVAVFSVGTGRAILAAWGVKDGKPVKLATFAVDANVGPRPPPIPPGPNPPDPKPPEPVKSFRVIFVYESSQALTPAMQRVMFGEQIRTYLDAKTTAVAGVGKGYRRYDKDVDATQERDANMKALWAAVKPKLTTIPCVVVEVNGKADILPFPTDDAAALELFKKYAGDTK